jgi:FlaA1/EpsC-like NDP-sugar epimerase
MEKRGVRALLLIIYDIITVNMAGFIALLVRFDFKYSNIGKVYMDHFLKFIPYNTAIIILVYMLGKLYSSVWRLASFNEVFNIIICSLICEAVEFSLMYVLKLGEPRSYYFIACILRMGFAVAARFSYRIARMFRQEYMVKRHDGQKKVMIVGAGEAGKMIADEIHTSSYVDYYADCFIDDRPTLAGRTLCGIPIIGDRTKIQETVEKRGIDIIIIAIPSMSSKERREIANICQETGKEVRILPGMYQLVNDSVSVSKLRRVNIDDLLGRDPIIIDSNQVFETLKGKRILVTGGGGSIGSELCRQIAAHAPGQLIIFDIYENNAYDIQQELRRNFPSLNMEVLIGSVRNTHRINSVFEKYKPQVVFHAAAHKHVPLMEVSPNEAIKNNVFGTYKTAKAAVANGTEKFILISTDKAVNPTNIMGASKRLCEMVIQMMSATQSTTSFAAVRFGNVLGSNGSVIPLFKKQIEAGGPVTVTHKDIIRYFMTIPEAVSLVLQASVYAKGGEIFVLDMGEPVKIDTLARNLIRLSGYTPDVDIEVKYTGLRPGEKLYEELLMNEEGLQDTDNGLIHIGKPIEMDYEAFAKELEELYTAASSDDEAIKQKVAQMVPTYKPANTQ